MKLVESFNAGRVPSVRMVRRGESSSYALMHFGLNTFTDKEWGYGDEDPALFNPSAFDADQIVGACREAGLCGLILVCKHHDGFCLWPTKTTEHCIRNSPFRGGKGDLVREISDACHRQGLRMGFYVSPWDRNHPAYGTPEYLDVYRQQLREIYTEYGPAFEAWFDGANGGDGYYGGAREKRSIDRVTYYDWQNTWKIVRELQPEACIFSDIGPDLRWVGNEKGLADLESFGSITPRCAEAGREPAPGYVDGRFLGTGEPDGRFYIPPECDVPLRPGWFFHESQNDQVRSLEELTNIYLHSVGSGGFLNLGIAPDKRGVLHENDVARLREFGRMTRALNGENVATQRLELQVGEMREWSWGGTAVINLLDLREDLSQGECITGYEVEVRAGEVWRPLLSGQAVGRRRLKMFDAVEADGLRFRLLSSRTGSGALELGCRHGVLPSLGASSPSSVSSSVGGVLSLSGGVLAERSVEYRFSSAVRARGFVFVPCEGCLSGTPDRYRFEVLGAGGWDVVSEGEFSNIRANPVPQEVLFAPVILRGCRLTALGMLESGGGLRFQSLGLLTCD